MNVKNLTLAVLATAAVAATVFLVSNCAKETKIDENADRAAVEALDHRDCASHDVNERLLAENPGMASLQQQIEEFTQNYLANMPAADRAATVTIPVVVHVVYKTAAQNLSDAQIQTQIDVLNEDFQKLNADVVNVPALFAPLAADCQIAFCLASTDPNGNPTTGIERRQTNTSQFNTSDKMKKYAQGGLDAWNRDKYLNLWVCNLSGSLLGYAQFPGGPAATDGVVCDYAYFGRNGSATAPYHLGRTATHEVGHWLNLRHIWGDATCGNDQVADTPLHNTSNGGCPTYPHLSTCTGTPVEMTMNYMDYTYDACMYMYSTGQKNRMQALFAPGGARVSLLTSNGCN